MGKPTDWLRKELDDWVADGLVSGDQAAAIRTRYPETAGKPWGVIIFGGLGAVIVGLGVILLFAYNWAAMPKGVKLAVVFGSLVAAHGGGLWLRFRTERWQGIGEALAVLGTMLFGAGIWLVAQIYHIEEHFPNAFLWWGLGAAAMAWAWPSAFQGGLAAVLWATLGLVEACEFSTSQWAAPLLTLAVLGPLAWRMRSRVLAALVVPAVILSLGGAVGVWEDDVLFHVIFAYAILLMGCGYLLKDIPERRGMGKVVVFYGLGTYFVCLYLLTFGDFAEELAGDRWEAFHDKGPLGIVLPLVIAALPWAWLGWKWWQARPARPAWPAEMALAPLTGLLLICYTGLGWAMRNETLLAAPFILVFLAHAAMRMARGCRQAILRDVVLGAVLLSLLVFARYFDLFESLLSRGVTFIVLGGVLFAEGILYAKAKKRTAGEATP